MPVAHANPGKHVRRRKIADLNEEQRERKRNTDRQAQQAFRERTKAQIQDLEDEIETMRQNSVENEEVWRAENMRLREQVRRLNQRLEQVRRVASGQAEVTREETDHAISATETARIGAQVAIPQPGQGTDSPGSMIEVEGVEHLPTTLNYGLGAGSKAMHGAGGNQHIGDSQLSPVIHDASYEIPEPRMHSSATDDNQLIAGTHVESPRDVLMRSYDLLSTSGQAGSTSAFHQQHSHPALSGHSATPDLIDNYLKHRRGVHDAVCEHHRTCPFDHILLDLVDARRLLLSSGSTLAAVLGPVQADITGLFYPQTAHQSHPISHVLVEMMQTFAHVRLPERAAFMYKIHKTLRWHIAPSQTTYDILPTWLRPTAKQITTPHAAWIDNIPWPAVRDMLVEQPNKYPFALFSEAYSLNVTISWPHREADIMVNLEGTSDSGYSLPAIFNPIFERHVRNLDNWTVAQAFKDCYPEMSEAVSSRH